MTFETAPSAKAGTTGTADTRASSPTLDGRVLRDWLALNRRLAFQPEQALALLGRVGGDPARALRELPAREERRGVARKGGGRHGDAEADAARLHALGVRALPIGSPGYPCSLERLVDAPPLLFARGEPRALAAPAVAIVGSRACTAYGRDVAATLAEAAARAGFAVVSGLALGIDAAAHRAALAAGGASIGVLARGLDGVYPARHRALAEALCERGCLLGELPLGTPPRAPYFPMRNRLIAGLARVVVVVEARERSGSLVTARLALDRGVEVLAVPGAITAPTSVGTNQLIRDGAAPILGVDDLLDALGAAPASRDDPHEAIPLSAPDDPLAAALLEVLRAEPLADEPLRAVLSERERLRDRLGSGGFELAVVELEIAGRIERDRDGRWRVRAAGRG